MPWLARTLDWPFPGLGRYVEIARMQGAAGEFFNVTWPGYVGVLTALAPGRFGASINQAPLRRRTHQRFLRPFDLAVNGLSTLVRQRSIPPDQLLRFVFEEADDYAEARRMLEIDADRASGDLYAGGMPQRASAASSSAPKTISRRAPTITARPMTGSKPARNGKAASARTRC